jgi:hypothetical protein
VRGAAACFGSHKSHNSSSASALKKEAAKKNHFFTEFNYKSILKNSLIS